MILSLLIAGNLIIKIEDHMHGINGLPTWYDTDCCSYRDCKPISDHEVEFSKDADGRLIATYIPVPGDKTKNKQFELRNVYGGWTSVRRISQDERYHVCINPLTGHPACFYDRPGM